MCLTKSADPTTNICDIHWLILYECCKFHAQSQKFTSKYTKFMHIKVKISPNRVSV